MKRFAITCSLLLLVALAVAQRPPIEIRRGASTVATATNAIGSDAGLGTNITLYGDNYIINSFSDNVTVYAVLTATNAILYTPLIYGSVDLNAPTITGAYSTNTTLEGDTVVGAVTLTGPVTSLLGNNLVIVTDSTGKLSITNVSDADLSYIAHPPLWSYSVNAGMDTNLFVGFAAVPECFATVTVSNDFTLRVTNYAVASCLAIRLVPQNFVSNYTVTLDSGWQRYGANFSSSTLTLQSNKNIILSLTSWGTANTSVAAAYKEQQ